MNQKGMTLIEILVVLCIIGLLSAILIPNFTNYKNEKNLPKNEKLLDASEAYTNTRLIIVKHCANSELNRKILLEGFGGVRSFSCAQQVEIMAYSGKGLMTVSQNGLELLQVKKTTETQNLLVLLEKIYERNEESQVVEIDTELEKQKKEALSELIQ